MGQPHSGSPRAGHPLSRPRHQTDHYNDHVSRVLTATEAKAKLLALLDEVAVGGEVEITKHGRTVARLVPATGPNSLQGKLTGVAMSAADDDDLFSTGEEWTLG